MLRRGRILYSLPVCFLKALKQNGNKIKILKNVPQHKIKHHLFFSIGLTIVTVISNDNKKFSVFNLNTESYLKNFQYLTNTFKVPHVFCSWYSLLWDTLSKLPETESSQQLCEVMVIVPLHWGGKWRSLCSFTCPSSSRFVLVPKWYSQISALACLTTLHCSCSDIFGIGSYQSQSSRLYVGLIVTLKFPCLGLYIRLSAIKNSNQLIKKFPQISMEIVETYPYIPLNLELLFKL